MRATYLIETRQWEDEAARMSVDTSGIVEISASAGNLFAPGLAAAKTGNRAAAEKALAELKALREKAASGGRAGHSHAEWYTQVWSAERARRNPNVIYFSLASPVRGG